MSSFLAMILFPHVKAKAQQEIDAVVGFERLPTLEDQLQLQYIARLFQEVLRWLLVTPISTFLPLASDSRI